MNKSYIVYNWGEPEQAPLRGKCTDGMCDVRVCVCLRVCQNSESVLASPSKFGVHVKVQRSTDSQRQKSGEKSGCVIPGSFHCLLLGGPHGFLQPLLVARVLRQLVCGTTLQLCSERRN